MPCHACKQHKLPSLRIKNVDVIQENFLQQWTAFVGGCMRWSKRVDYYANVHHPQLMKFKFRWNQNTDNERGESSVN